MKNCYPWFIALSGMLILMTSNGLAITGISVFDESLLTTFEWDRGALKLRDMITFAIAALLAPLAGVLIDRIGVKPVLIGGLLVLAAAMYGYGAIDGLRDMYLIHALFGVVLATAGLNVAVILVSGWFTRHRGMAIGIALVGSSLGGVVFPQLGTWLIETRDWRSAFQFEALIPLAMLIWVVLLVRQGRATADSETLVAPSASVDISYGTALRSPTFWALAIIAMTTFYTVLGAQAHLFLYLRSASFSPASATNAISALFTAALLGKFLFGLLADHFDRTRVLTGNIVLMLVGAIFLARMDTALIWWSCAAFGFGWGGLYTLLQFSVVETFGLSNAGKILGTITILDAFGGGLGIWLTGALYERFDQSYEVPFTIFLAMLVVALIATRFIKPVAPATQS